MMQDEKNKEHGCKIFTILFKNNEQQYDFGKAEGKAELILQNISQLGGTYDYYFSEKLKELINSFKQINEAINNNFGLKLNK